VVGLTVLTVTFVAVNRILVDCASVLVPDGGTAAKVRKVLGPPEEAALDALSYSTLDPEGEEEEKTRTTFRNKHGSLAVLEISGRSI
jgi:hypothetical protein